MQLRSMVNKRKYGFNQDARPLENRTKDANHTAKRGEVVGQDATIVPTDRQLYVRQSYYAELRALSRYQLRGKDVSSSLPAHIRQLLDNGTASIDTDTSTSTAGLQFLGRSYQEFDAVHRGDMESLALAGGSEQDIFPSLHTSMAYTLEEPVSSRVPLVYDSDEETPASPLPSIGMSRSPSLSASDNSSEHSPAVSTPGIDEDMDVPMRRLDDSPSRANRESAIRADGENSNSNHDDFQIVDEDDVDDFQIMDEDNVPSSSWTHSTQPAARATHRTGDPQINRAFRPDTKGPFDHHQPSSQADDSDAEFPPRLFFSEALTKRDGVGMLFHHLQHFQGCKVSSHAKRLAEHNYAFANTSSRHHRLKDIANIGASWNIFADPNLLTNPCHVRHSMGARDLCYNIEGREASHDGGFGTPRSVCVHASDVKADQDVGSHAEFDCSHHMGWALSFAAFKKGLSAYKVAPRTQQIQARAHMPPDGIADGIFSANPHSTFNLSTVVHLCIARCKDTGALVYIYFPRVQSSTSMLTAEQCGTWNSRIWLPALAKTAPNLAESSRENKKSKSAEDDPARGRVRDQRSEYELDAACCRVLWDAVLEIVSDNAELDVFRGAQIFFTARENQASFRDEKLANCLDKFDTHLHASYNLDHIYQLVVTVDKDVTPQGSKPRSAFFRECCVKQAVQDLFTDRDGNPCAPSQRMCVYNHCGLRDLANFTATPPAGAVLADWGLLQVQWYTNMRPFDAAGGDEWYPFAEGCIDQLAAGTKALSALSSRRKPDDLDTVRRAWTRGKRRMYKESTKREFQSHSARERVLLTYNAFRELLDHSAKAKESEIRDSMGESAQPGSDLHPFYSIPTQELQYFFTTIIGYRWTLLEYLLVNTSQRPCPEQTRVLQLIIDMTRAFVQPVNLPSRRQLWLHVVPNERRARVDIGAGFARTMVRHGFCWTTPSIDWTSHTFIAEYRRHILFPRSGMRIRFESTMSDVVHFDVRRTAVLRCGKIVQRWRERRVHLRALLLLVNVVLQQFREDVFATIKHEIRPDLQGRLNEASTMFCWDDVSALYNGELHLSGVDRAMDATEDPSFLGQRYFGKLDQSRDADDSRLHFHRKPYRQLAWQADQIMSRSEFELPAGSALHGSVFQNYLRLELLDQHSLLPHISVNHPHLTDVHKVKGRRPLRKWIAVQRSKTGTRNSLYHLEKDLHYHFGGRPAQGRPPNNPTIPMHPRKAVDELETFAKQTFGER